jgi:hypothetical protein
MGSEKSGWWRGRRATVEEQIDFLEAGIILDGPERALIEEARLGFWADLLLRCPGAKCGGSRRQRLYRTREGWRCIDCTGLTYQSRQIHRNAREESAWYWGRLSEAHHQLFNFRINHLGPNHTPSEREERLTARIALMASKLREPEARKYGEMMEADAMIFQFLT